MLALKLGLVVASVLLATLAARRYGHGVTGTLAGMPVIAAPIMLFVLAQQPAQAGPIALATLVCLPATIAHLVVFGLCAVSGLPWWAGLVAANATIVGGGWALGQLPLPAAGTYALAVAAPLAGLKALQLCARRAGTRLAPGGPVAIPRSELAWRVAVAVAMAAAVMLGADALPPMVSGLLLAVPIAGNVLPCFTLPRYGAAATAALLAGFVRGMFGFAAFFIVLHLLLPRGALLAALAALLAALGTALTAHALHRHLTRR